MVRSDRLERKRPRLHPRGREGSNRDGCAPVLIIDMAENTIFASILFGVGAVFIGFGLPLFQERVPPNFWYGCRTSKALSDQKIWYAVNRVTGKSMIEGGALMMAAALLMFALRNSLRPGYAAGGVIVLVILSTTFLVINSLRTQKRF